MKDQSCLITKTFILILCGAVFLSSVALVYHTRWFITCLIDHASYTVPKDQIPFIWFFVQITSSIIFIYVGLLLVRLIRNYRKTNFFGIESFNIFNTLIFSCLLLAFMGTGQFIATHFYEVKIEEWTSMEAIFNRLLRFVVKFLFIENPQTMYFLLAMVLWIIKQFVAKALELKKENESFI